MFITLYFIVTRLPDSLRSVRDHFLTLDPTSLTVELLEQHLLAGETSAVAVFLLPPPSCRRAAAEPLPPSSRRRSAVAEPPLLSCRRAATAEQLPLSRRSCASIPASAPRPSPPAL
ncbi:unnamed protein product, partial [Closterium sp. NIES-54]